MASGQHIVISNSRDYVFFMLQVEGFKDGYINEIKPMPGAWGVSHPPAFYWKGGKFKPLSLQLDLAAGVHAETAAKLSEMVQKLFTMSMPSKTGLHIPDRIMVQIGSWFTRSGFMKEFDVQWMGPIDISSGNFHRALVSFSLEADFNAVKEKNGQYTYDTGKLPTASNYNWNYTGG